MAASVIHVYHERAASIADVVRRAAPTRTVVAWTTPSQLADGLADVEVMFAPLPPRDGWAAARALRLVQLAGAGVDSLLPSPDLPVAVEVAGVRGVFAAEVAEHVLASMLALVRRLPEILDDQRAHRWSPRSRPTLAGMTVAILGQGEVGRRVARLAAALDMRVIGLCRSGRPADGILAIDHLADALDRAHVLVICAPLTPATAGLIDTSMLRRMAPGGYVIDVSRGGIVDETALVAALRGGRLAGAALDVFATEPLPAEHPLWSAPGAIVSPHIAGRGERYLERCVEVLVANVDRLDAGQPRLHLVDRALGY